MAKGKSYRIPRLAWLLLLPLVIPQGFAESRPRPVMPPQPVPVRVRVMRGTAVEIPLRVYGDPGKTVTFQVRRAPEYGRVSTPRPTGRDSAVLIYQQLDDGTHGADRFLVVSKSSDGVSAPAEVTIRIVDPDPVFMIPQSLDFGTVTIGEPASNALTIENRTGAVAEGRIECTSGWKVEGDASYRLAAGENRSFIITCTETREGELRGTVRYTSNPTRETELLANIRAPLDLGTGPVELQFDPAQKRRVGTVHISNRGAEPRVVQIEHSERLSVPERSEVPGGGEISLRIETAEGDAGPVNEQLLVISDRFLGEITVHAALAQPALRTDKTQLNFGRLLVAQPGNLTLEVENTGGAPAAVRAETVPPFYLITGDNAFSVEPGGRHVIRIGAQPVKPGAAHATLSLKAAGSEVLVSMELEGVSRFSPNAPPAPVSSPLLAAPEAPPQLEPVVQEADILPAPVLFIQDPVASSPNVAPVGKVTVERIGPDWCELAWPATGNPGRKYQIEMRRLSLDGEQNVKAQWTICKSVSFSESSKQTKAVVKRLTSGWFYTFRVCAVNASGEFSTPSGLVTVQTTIRPPAVTPVRTLLGCLALLVLVMWWQRRALARAVGAETVVYEPVARKDWWE